MITDPRIEWIEHPDPESWVHAVATEMEAVLAEELAARGSARMLLSGGTTPAPIYAQLAVAPLDWPKITVGLADERWLSPQDSASNAYLVRENLLDRAEVGRFEPLVREGLAMAESVHAANLEAEHAQDACLVVLGMGNDGHTASLFPGSVDLDRALDSEQPYAAMDATGCPVAGDWTRRITLTPAGLARTRRRLLLLRGQAKREVLQRALAGDDVRELPIRVMFGLGGEPMRVHWCA
ncbi:6-phosphogluconolactonase [Pseudoxanthomonas broegbernensis]|uniref:6-phosphogluconolactonase n=1 Tax=Pseudoxanthomonas broegbernensis TaxID=83619 RepID=A0A7V8GP77_9GAMM|nr:6-phosphogluconolactonase [Pseudoxanthomonas broegbernensis]KAF1687593.1 6-phosphogluconolactonase [Pseudoxanthomonas broegbernensis]MBB6064614.1 6-phosphogluconolactonase [Pseudoxanthomonas broegbernensis]